ncbi:MAG: 16S rRNA (cytosine(1402)-N(4))-methyltransferase RsmH [Candidatus Pacebacteria bacterium]|nr:16S rRNA (cytosine(1402)-N(4))-methyltransferase RsmH [Candidatus Paceibacterota bacterium]
MVHNPVLKKEVIEVLNPKSNENFIDSTAGEGGHSILILEKNKPNGRVLAIDWDLKQIENIKFKIKEDSDLSKRLILANGSYLNLREIAENNGFRDADGVLFDLGMSSWHLEKSGRGFSFLKDEPLDMRFDPNNDLTAEKIINRYPIKEIERILKEYGEERLYKRIAEGICRNREIKSVKTTFELVGIIRRAVPLRYQNKRINPATRTFQALRIAVNDELNNLKEALYGAVDILKPKGRLVVISFHSLEDRIVKNFLKELDNKKIKILIKKPITPDKEEIKINRRSRSAKLRAAVKI